MREAALDSPGRAATALAKPRQTSSIRRLGRRPQPSQRYFAFLSYSHADAELADWLHEAIENFRVPRKLVGQLTENGPIPRRLQPIFRDRGELAASGSLSEEIEQALVGSRYLIVLCSPAAATSRWANLEIESFKHFHPDGLVLAAIVDGEPFASEIPGRETEECFPAALRVEYDQRGRPTRRRAEPIAADLREGRDGRQGGLLKIIAGMLGVGLDDLVQRETHRRHRRLAFLAAASVVDMAVTSGLAVFAFDARDAARDQRREAESLIGFMLGDLRDKLEPIGELDTLDGVGARVLAYYRKQDKKELTDASLIQRSRALTLLGEIAQRRGDMDGALHHYREAMAGTAELVSRAPEDPKRLYDHAQNVFWAGWVARDRGQMEQAEAAMREYRRLAERMIAAEPANAEWRMEQGNANVNLGIVLLDRRRFAEASRRFAESLRTIDGLTAAEPANAAYQRSLADSLAWVADAQQSEGRLEEAIVQRQWHVRLLDRLIASSGGDVLFRQRLVSAYRALGNVYASQGRLDPAIRSLRTALAESDKLIPREPDNSKWLDAAAKTRLSLAEALLDDRQIAEAASQTEAGCRLFEGLLAKDRSVAPWRAGLRDCHSMRARIALATGATDEALRHAGQALDAAESVKSSDSVGDRYMLARVQLLVGDIHRKAGDGLSARSAWQAGLRALPMGVQERPPEMADRAELLRRLGRAAEAEPLAARLSAMGFRKTS